MAHLETCWCAIYLEVDPCAFSVPFTLPDLNFSKYRKPSRLRAKSIPRQLMARLIIFCNATSALGVCGTSTFRKLRYLAGKTCMKRPWRGKPCLGAGQSAST